MKTLRRAWRRLAGSFAGRRREAEMAEEFESHIEMLAADNRRRGMSPAEARRAALLIFGGVEPAKELYRDQRGLPALEILRQDLRYAVRGMRRRPLFAASAIACIALGIGANTAIFSLFHAVMFRALPVRDPGRLVFFQYDDGGADVSAVRNTSSGYGHTSFPYATFEAFRDRARTLDGVFVFVASGIEGNGVTVKVAGHPVTTEAEMVTGGYFSVLGVAPVIGRMIADADLQPEAPDVAVISHRLWISEFGGDPSAVGRGVVVNGRPFAVVGVAPPSFLGLHGAPGIWTPLRLSAALKPWNSRLTADRDRSAFTNRRYWWCAIGGRLKPGVTRAAALSETNYLFRQSITAHLAVPPRNLPWLAVSTASPSFEAMRKKLSAPLAVLMVAAGLVLLIACANVAALLSARAVARRKEITVRLAIGASSRRLVRQLLTESLFLSGIGGALGVLSARWGAPALLRLIAGERVDSPLDISLDLAVLAFAVAASVATGVLFGLAPALRAARVDLAPALAGAARSTTERQSAGRWLLVAQIAFSAILLFAAGLFVRTFHSLDSQKLGFDRDRLLLFEVDPERSGYTDANGIALHGWLLARLSQVPSIRSVSYSQIALLAGGSNTGPAFTDDDPLPAGPAPSVYQNRVGPSFFETMGIRMLLGRGIGLRDVGPSHPTAVVNDAWVRRFFPAGNPLGRRLSIGSDHFRPEQSYEIVGVAEDAKYNRMRETAPPTVYVSYGARWDRSRRLCYAVRVGGDPSSVVASVRAAVREVDPELVLFNVRSQRQQIREALGQERMLAHISSFFGAAALLLVSIGLYGSLAYSVGRRSGEIGIRLALGARRGAILWMIVRESLVTAVLGISFGMPVALALSRLLTQLLFGVTPFDGAAMAVSVIVLAAGAAVAGLIPAYRAAHTDPMRALRNE